ncbi:MAG: efflux RND transporter permease subunit [Lachnospiraceae bacterium]|nr:efflux RND transporter permease subunit [Lachnospiraceae bacterium]
MIEKLSVKKPYTILVGVCLVIILGIVSFTRMTSDLMPNISLPYVIIMTTYPGASPETVEMVVTKPVEAMMATASNIENISSVSNENYSLVILEFAQNANMDSVSLELREKIDQIKPYWDDSVGNPIIMKMNPDMMPVMISAVGGKDMSYSEISELVTNKIVPELESIEGVASVSTSGLLEESVHVIIRQEKIDEINKQVFGYIEGEMADAELKLAEGRDEILEGQEKLNEAQQELDDARKELLDGKKEVRDGRLEIADGKKELADGKIEIADGKKELNKGRDELSNKQEEVISQMAEAEKMLLTGKASLEAAKIQIMTNIASVKALAEGADLALQGLPLVEQGISGITLLITELNNLINDPAIAPMLAFLGINIDVDNDSIDVLIATFSPLAAVPMAPPQIQDLIDALNLFKNSMANAGTKTLPQLLDQLNAQKTTINNTLAALNAATMSMGATQYINLLNTQLAEIEKNLATVNEGIIELSKGNITAAIEFAGGKMMIELGEFQLNAAELQLDAVEKQLEAAGKQLDAAIKQIETGEEQLVSGQETIDENFQKLLDALDQITEGEEQLAEAKENALLSADMHGIITVDLVKALLAAQNFSMPGGYVTEEGVDYLVRVGDKPDNIDDLQAMPLLNMQMEGVDIITLEMVADVFMTDNSGEIYANVNGSNGVILTIQKQTGYSTGAVSDRLLKKYEELKQQDQRIVLITFMDQGIYIDLVTGAIVNNIVFGAILAVLFLAFFLRDIKPTLVIACSIPISLITAVALMYFSGVTLNVISLSGLALGIGMLIDNSIVVIENIYRMRAEGKSRIEAAIQGTREVRGAIIAATLTTICVFAPIIFTEGITRQLFIDMGLTIGYSLGASLLVAMTVVPALASKLLSTAEIRKEFKWYQKLVDVYEKGLHFSLKYKFVVLIPAIVLLILSGVLSYSKGFAFMDDMDSPQMSLTLEFPADTLLEKSSTLTDRVVEIVRGIPEVIDSGATTGGGDFGMLMGGGMGSASTNQTSVYVLMSEDKKRTNVQIAAELQGLLKDIVEEEHIELSIQTSDMDISMLSGSGIAINIFGRELDTLQAIAAEVAKIVESVDGTTEVFDGSEDLSGELRVIIDRNKAIEHGLTVAQIFQQIYAKLSSATSSTALITEIRDYDVYVKHAGDLALTRETLKEIDIDVTDRDGKKEKVRLAEMASFEDAYSANSIRRRDQTRYASVTAQIADGYNVTLVTAAVDRALAGYSLPQGYELSFDGEDEFINEAMSQLYLMLILALLFMFLIMVAQFQSLTSPFIVMFTVPLAFTGGFLALLLSNNIISIISLIGFILLAGVIVSNGIVLIDYVNQLRERGMSKYDALIKGGRTRLRPVLMMAVTTILAMSMMVFSNDMGATISRPMALVAIGGLAYGTLMTLFVIPCIYDILNRDKDGMPKEKKRSKVKNVIKEIAAVEDLES